MNKNRIVIVICNLFRNYYIMITMMRKITVTVTMSMMMMLIIIPLFTLGSIYSTDPSGPKQTKIIYPSHKLSTLTARPRCLFLIYKYRFQTNLEVVN